MDQAAKEISQTLALAGDIVSAYVGQNSIPANDVPAFLQSVYKMVVSLDTAEPEVIPKVEQVPAVPIKKSITDDYMISLEDGKKFKSLKRHLSTAYGMTPDQYRAKWGLPKDYPMVAPGYAATRSKLAKSIGLGRKTEPTSAKIAAKKVAAEPKKRGPKAKAT